MKTVSIFTHSFLDGYNRDFSRVFGGGLERYIYELCGVIRDMGYTAEVHQLSFFEPFHTTIEDIDVYGYPYDFDNVSEAFERMAQAAKGALIYASCIWHPIAYRPGSLGICHGINWDNIQLSEDVKLSVIPSIQHAVRRLSHIVTVDSHFLTYSRSVCHFDNPEQINLIPNAVDTTYFQPLTTRKNPEQPLRLLFPRRLSLERGLVPMMLVSDRLLKQYPNLLIEFAGERIADSAPGLAFDIWRKSHPHNDRILHQTYSFDTMLQAYQAADIAVIPTIFSEGTSFACLEAMSCGLPVVATHIGGLNDLIIDGYNGLKVPPTEDRLYEALCQLIEHAPLRSVLGETARSTALAFDKQIWRKRWTAMLQAYLKT